MRPEFMPAAKRAPIALQIAAYVILASGFFDVYVLAALLLHGRVAAIDSIASLWALVKSLLLMAMGAGILYGHPIWRALAAWGVGIWCGGAIAALVCVYRPLGQHPWDFGSLGNLLYLAGELWILWALTNPATQLYVRRRHEERFSRSATRVS